jgi:hypothetical protein
VAFLNNISMRSAYNSFGLWFGIIMIIAVTAMALAMFFTDYMSDKIYGTKRMGFAALLILYAVYRAYRLKAFLRNRP